MNRHGDRDHPPEGQRGHARRGPAAIDLRCRFDAFPGIGQKKAAMAVEILARDLGKPLRELAGSDVAYDVQHGVSSSAPDWPNETT